jgi:hypothetical protein
MKRCGFDLSEPDPPEEANKLIHRNFKRLLPEEMTIEITDTLKKNPEIGLIIIDVVTDLADDGVMEMKDALKVLKLFNSINEEIGIICSIHVNEGEGLKKPSRGHLGRELERKCSATVYLTKEDDDTIKIEITANRIGGNSEPIYYTWNDNLGMFVESDYKPINIDLKEKHIKEIQELFVNKNEQSTKVLKAIFFKLHPGTSVKNFDYYIAQWKQMGLIESPNRGIWRIKNV